MRQQNLTSTIPVFAVLFIALIAFGCQKPTSKDAKLITTPNDETLIDEKVPANVCSQEILKKGQAFYDGQIQSKTAYEKIVLQNDAAAKEAYSKSAEMQIAACKAIIDQMETEKISSCLKSATEKTKENSLNKDQQLATCKTVGNWGKSVTKEENTYTETTVPKIIRLQLTAEGIKSLKEKTAGEFLYLIDGKVKAGKEDFKADVAAGALACSVSNLKLDANDSAVFKYVAEVKATAADLGIETKAAVSIVTLQNSKGAISSLICANSKLSSESDRASNLKKIFKSLATIEELTKGDPKLNADVAPAIHKTAEKAAASEAAAAEKTKALEQTIDKARETMQTMLRDALVEVKKTSVEIAKESLVEAQKTSAVIISAAVSEAQTAAASTIAVAIEQAQAAASTTITQTINQAQVAADATVEKAVDKAQVAATQVVTTAITEGKVAANEVVDQGISKAKTAAVDTIAAPFTWVGEKASSVWQGIKGFFSSSEDTIYEIKKTDRKK